MKLLTLPPTNISFLPSCILGCLKLRRLLGVNLSIPPSTRNIEKRWERRMAILGCRRWARADLLSKNWMKLKERLTSLDKELAAQPGVNVVPKINLNHCGLILRWQNVGGRIFISNLFEILINTWIILFKPLDRRTVYRNRTSRYLGTCLYTTPNSSLISCPQLRPFQVKGWIR